MKFCPNCKTGFPDHAETCPMHGGYLSEIVDLKPGMVVRNTYRIVRKLGQGGFGSVYLAHQTLMEEPRALKFLSAQYSQDESFTARFRREVRTLRQVRHRNVVDCGDMERAEDDSLFFSMEYVDGPDLRHLLDKATQLLDVPQVLKIARGIAEGLAAAHTKGMIHRDIKPENILMATSQDSYIPKIADFGVVATKETSTLRTRTGATLLTMAYAAPEQWRGTPAADLDGRTDIYALGGVLFEMLIGRTVFEAESYEGWATQHLNASPTPPSTLRPDLANWRWIDTLIVRMLSKDRNDRPKDAGEVIKLLDTVRYIAPELHQRTVAEETWVRAASAPVISSPASRPPSLWKRSPAEAWLGLFAGIVFSFVAAIIVTLAVHGNGPLQGADFLWPLLVMVVGIIITIRQLAKV